MLSEVDCLSDKLCDQPSCHIVGHIFLHTINRPPWSHTLPDTSISRPALDRHTHPPTSGNPPSFRTLHAFTTRNHTLIPLRPLQEHPHYPCCSLLATTQRTITKFRHPNSLTRSTQDRTTATSASPSLSLHRNCNAPDSNLRKCPQAPMHVAILVPLRNPLKLTNQPTIINNNNNSSETLPKLSPVGVIL